MAVDNERVRLDVIPANIRVPEIRRGSVSRTGLVNRLRTTGSVLVTVVAPAGYGKTTLLAQWAARDERPFAWVSIDERDNDPVVLLTHVAAALDRIGAVDASVVDALRSPSRSVWRALLPRLASVLSTTPEPMVLVLDNADLLRAEAAEAVAVLADHVSARSLLVVVGRIAPELPIAVLRASGRLVELGADQLALSRREAQLLLRETGVALGETDVDMLVRRTEGWAVGLYLAALSIGDQTHAGRGAADVGGDDRYLADYFRSECLSDLSAEDLDFLRSTSTLERMSGALCDAVLERTGSALELERFERANLFLVPLDQRRGWFRYHDLFADLLRRELEHHEPEAQSVLSERAADWFETHREPEAALEAAAAAGDTDRVARLLVSLALPLISAGRVVAVEAWLGGFDETAQLGRYPAVAVVAAWVHALQGRAEAAERALEAAERGACHATLPDGSTSLRPWIAIVRAALCRDGVEQMLSDAGIAVSELPADSRWRPIALLLQGTAFALLGADEPADEVLAAAVAAAEGVDAADTRAAAIGARVAIATRRRDHAAADALADEARDPDSPAEADATCALALAGSARVLLRRGRWDEARSELSAARRLEPSLTHALPWLAVQARLELACAYLALYDVVTARTLVADARQILRRRPGLGALCMQIDELTGEIDLLPDVGADTASALTTAELRLLPFLATHLSFREIGERLFVSRATIKTHATSVYRKLGVSSRSAAIEQAAHLGLVEVNAAVDLSSPTSRWLRSTPSSRPLEYASAATASGESS